MTRSESATIWALLHEMERLADDLSAAPSEAETMTDHLAATERYATQAGDLKGRLDHAARRVHHLIEFTRAEINGADINNNSENQGTAP